MPAGRRPVGRRQRLGRDLVLAWAATGPLAGDDDPLDEQLPSPYTPRLLPFDRAGQARRTDGAVGAQGLGVLDVGRRLGEEQLRVERPAGEQITERIDLGGPGVLQDQSR